MLSIEIRSVYSNSRYLFLNFPILHKAKNRCENYNWTGKISGLHIELCPNFLIRMIY